MTSGIGQYEHQLSDQPPLGEWTVVVQHGQDKTETLKRFDVLEYQLPTFEAKVEMNKKFSLEKGIISGNVVANYTFGKPVKAVAQVTITNKNLSLNESHFWPEDEPHKEFKFEVKIEAGKGPFELNLIEKMNLAKKISNNNGRSLYFEFQLSAVVNDSLSGKQAKTDASFSLVESKYDLQVLNKYSQTFFPGFKHRVLLSLTDSDELPVSSNTDSIAFGWKFSSEKHFHESQLIPIDGLVEYEFDTPKEANQIMLRAMFRGEKFDLGYVTQVHSEQDIQLRLQDQTRRPPTRHLTGVVGEPLQFVLKCRQELDQVQVYVINSDLNTLLHFENVTSTKPGQQELTFELHPTEQWRHKVTVMALRVYTSPDTNKFKYVDDKLKLRIISNQKSIVRIDCPIAQAKPGEPFHMNVLSSAHSLVGVLGMDFALQLMRQGNDITESDVLEALNLQSQRKFSKQGCWASYQRVNYSPLIILNNFEHSDGDEILFDYCDVTDDASPPVLFGRAGGVMNEAFTRKMAAPIRVGAQPTILQRSQSKPPQNQVRKNFPETWLWKLLNSE